MAYYGELTEHRERAPEPDSVAREGFPEEVSSVVGPEGRAGPVHETKER